MANIFCQWPQMASMSTCFGGLQHKSHIWPYHAVQSRKCFPFASLLAVS